MKWILVLVGVFNGEIITENKGLFPSMTDCFQAREEAVIEYFGNYTGQPPVNYQVVCIPSDKY